MKWDIEMNFRILNDDFVHVLALPDNLTQEQSDNISREIDKLNEQVGKIGKE